MKTIPYDIAIPKGGVNREYQIKQRPPDPPPIPSNRPVDPLGEPPSTPMPFGGIEATKPPTSNHDDEETIMATPIRYKHCVRGHLDSICGDSNGDCIECSIIETGQQAAERLELFREALKNIAIQDNLSEEERPATVMELTNEHDAHMLAGALSYSCQRARDALKPAPNA